VSAILELARRLGEAIGQSPQSAKLQETRKALDAEPETRQLLAEYQAQAEKIAVLEEANKPVEVDDKHRLQSLHDKLVASAAFKKYTAAQVDFLDVMRQVNEAISEGMGGVDVATEPPPTTPRA